MWLQFKVDENYYVLLFVQSQIMSKYWIRRPETSTITKITIATTTSSSKDKNTDENKNKSRNKNKSKEKRKNKRKCIKKKEMSIFTLPDVIQQKIFLWFHPRGIYILIPFICKWWKHLVLKQDFLTDIVHTYLKIECPCSPLTYMGILPHLEHCCRGCGNDKTLTKSDMDNILVQQSEKLSNKEIDYIKVPFDAQHCENCFLKYEKNQAMLAETAKDLFKLNKQDLAPIKQQYNPLLFSLKLYVRVSDVKCVAMDKFGNNTLLYINELTPFEIGDIEKNRQSIIKSKIRRLKKKLLQDAITKQNEMKIKRQVSSLFDSSSGGSDNDDNGNDSGSGSEEHNETSRDDSNDRSGSGNENESESESESEGKFENVKWPTASMMKNARKQYKSNELNRQNAINRRNDEISNIELQEETIKSELETFLSSQEYNHFLGFAFFKGNEDDIKLCIQYSEILNRFEDHLQRVRQRKWKIRHRTDGSWYQDWFDSTWTNDWQRF